MSMLKIKKGDTVKVIAGKGGDKETKVIAVNQMFTREKQQEWASKWTEIRRFVTLNQQAKLLINLRKEGHKL